MANNQLEQAACKANTEEMLDHREYFPPKLVCLGKVAELTSGGSIGVGDSGNYSTQKPYGSGSFRASRSPQGGPPQR